MGCAKTERCGIAGLVRRTAVTPALPKWHPNISAFPKYSPAQSYKQPSPASFLSTILNHILNQPHCPASSHQQGGAAGTYLGELLSVGQVVHRDGQEDIQQSICRQLRMHKSRGKDMGVCSHPRRVALGAPRQLGDKLLAHPIHPARSSSPGSSSSAPGVSRAAPRVVGAPQRGEEEGAEGWEGWVSPGGR